MFDIEFKIGGRRITTRNAGNALERAVLGTVQKNISQKLGSAICPEHQQRPKVLAEGRSLDAMSFKITGCCEQAVEAAKKKLGQRCV